MMRRYLCIGDYIVSVLSQVHVGSHLVYTDTLGTVATTIESN